MLTVRTTYITDLFTINTQSQDSIPQHIIYNYNLAHSRIYDILTINLLIQTLNQWVACLFGLFEKSAYMVQVFEFFYWFSSSNLFI